jgi:hypothetical protein
MLAFHRLQSPWHTGVSGEPVPAAWNSAFCCSLPLGVLSARSVARLATSTGDTSWAIRRPVSGSRCGEQKLSPFCIGIIDCDE